MFQKELEAQPPEARAELQRERLRALRRRLLGLDSRYWRAKLDGIEEDAALADLPFTIKSELRDEYPFGTLAVPLAETVRGSAQPSSRRQAATSSSSCSRTSARRGWRARRALRCCSRSVAPAATFTCVYGVFGVEPWSEAMREKLEAVWGSTPATSTASAR